jgi:hypothetical protein
MSNPQQPEMRRSGHDPLVTDSAKEKAAPRPAPRGGARGKDTRPADQRSPYEPGTDPEGAPEEQAE